MADPRGGIAGPSETSDRIPIAVLAPLIESARHRWPALTVGDQAFESFLRARRPAQAEPDATGWLASLHVPDLYLACASLAGEPRALTLLESLVDLVAKEVVERHPWCAVAASDLRGTLLSALLIAEDGGPPRLAQYGGRGPLASFLRVCAIRMALDDRDARSHQVPLDDVDLAERAVGAGADEELGRLKQMYRPVFEAVMREAVAALEPRARNLIRLHHLERLPCERIASLYHVHTATAWRWLERTHRELRDDILRRLADRLGAEIGDAESILRLVWSHLDDSLRLSAGGDPP